MISKGPGARARTQPSSSTVAIPGSLDSQEKRAPTTAEPTASDAWAVIRTESPTMSESVDAVTSTVVGTCSTCTDAVALAAPAVAVMVVPPSATEVTSAAGACPGASTRATAAS